MPRRSPALALALAFILAGACGKDEPEKPPATPPTTEQTPSPKTEERAAEAPTPAPAAPKAAEEPAKAKDDAPTPPPSSPAPASAVGPLTPVSLPSFDPGVTAVVGTPSLAGLVEAFATTSSELGADQQMPPRPLDAALEALRMRLNLVDVAWLDTGRPLRLATPDPKRFPDGFVAILPVKGGEEALKKGLGEGLSTSEGHLGQLDAGGRSIFVDLAGDQLVVTSHDGLKAAIGPWLKDVLMVWTPRDVLNIEVSVSHLRTAYAEELRMMRGMIGRVGEQLTQRSTIPVQAETLRALIDGAFGFVEGTERVGLAVVPSGDRLQVAFGLRGEEGSDLASTIASVVGRKLEVLGAAPPETWLGVASNLPSALTEIDQGALTSFLTSIDGASFTEAQAKALAAHVATLHEVNTGDSTFAVATDGRFPFAISSLDLVTDHVKAREALLGLFDVVLQAQLAKLRAQLAENGAEGKFELDSLADLVTLANTMGKPLGASLEVVDETRGEVVVKALVATVDWERLGLAQSDPGFFAAVQAMVGPKLSAAMADGEGRMAVAFGPHGVDAAVALAGGKLPGGEPNLTRAGEGEVAAVSLRVGAMLSALSALPSLERYAEEYAKLPKDKAITLRATVDGPTLQITADVALDLFRVLVR